MIHDGANDGCDDQTFSRRRFATALAGGALLTAIGASGASAGRSWCRVDPVVSIDGQLADIFIASDVKMLLTATAPVKLRIAIPRGSRGQVILADLGFGKGYDISFVQSAVLTRSERQTPTIVEVYAPSRDDTLPVTVTFAPRTLDSSLGEILLGMSAEGNANSWVKLQP